MTTPRRLAPDNFTPATRTPWGGRRIIDDYKGHLGIVRDDVVGESWEISVEPSFPSLLADDQTTLGDLIASAPRAWLGQRDAERYGQCPLLVKLLDSAAPLSVQVHPADGDPALAADESGKPESWVVLASKPGSGLYLGFRDGVDRNMVARCLEQGGRLDDMMTFVPVSEGDAFVIDAGTPHAIGEGVTLLEPQHVTPGRRGLTYRFWDWNRRYDAAGQPSPDGRPRELHVERSLAVTRWDGPRGEEFVSACRQSPKPLPSGDVVRTCVVDWRWFRVERWSGSGAFQNETDRLSALTCVAGEATVTTATGSMTLRKGESGVVPAAAHAFEVALTGADIFVTATAS